MESDNYEYSIGKFRLFKCCEKVKIALSTKNEVFIFVESFTSKLDIEYILTRKKLEEIIEVFSIEKIEECFRNILSKAKIKKDDIENVI